MKTSVRFILVSAVCASVVSILAGCGKAPPPQVVLAPPGPGDLGPATGLSDPPSGAVVFDLKYRAQTGGADDLQYHSYWGYGGSDEETKTNSFLQEVRKTGARVKFVSNPTFSGRSWAAVELRGGQATALFFDLDADGKLGEGERISPTRIVDQGVEFITPDFLQNLREGGQVLCRTLLQVNFYGGSSEPNFMWSPAAMLEGTARYKDQSARLLLMASQPGGPFDQYGSSSYALLTGDAARVERDRYFPRETLSSLVASDGEFYHLTIEGRRSNGLPARALLVADTSPRGTLAIRLVGSNFMQSVGNSLYLRGVEDQTVCFRLDAMQKKIPLPVGGYVLNSGSLDYGTTNSREWGVSFTEGPQVTVKADADAEVTLGQPVLSVRAVEETERYNSRAVESATFKKGARIYLEPRISGKSKERFGRFQQASVGRTDRSDRPPKVTITGPDGKQVLSKTMEYG